MNNTEELRSIVERQKRNISGGSARIGDVVSQIMENRLSPRYARFGGIVELWGQLLPRELAEHCKLQEISGGQLKVAVDSPSYLHELRLCGPELLAELQKHCPRARIKDIKFVIGSAGPVRNGGEQTSDEIV